MNKKQKPKQRNIYLDIIRGIAVFLVLWGHSLQYFSTWQINIYENTAFRFIYSFHMPLFMLLSGYFFYFTVQKNNVTKLIFNRLRTIGIPLVSWGILIALSEYYFSRQISLKDIWFQIENIWFLWSVLIASLIVGITYRIFRKFKWCPLMHIAIFLILFLAPTQLRIIQDYRTLYVYPYFIIGFLYNEYKDKIPNVLKLVRYLSIPLYIIMFPQFHQNTYIYTTQISILNSALGTAEQLKIDMFRWGIGLVGSLLVMVIVELLIKSRYLSIILNLLFSRLGTISLQVYVVQRVLLEGLANRAYNSWVAQNGKNILLTNINAYNFYWTPLIATLFAIGIYWLVKLLCLNKYIKFVLFGGR
ncbi:MAG: DUF1624 domain-containing protein [Lachnospiraceae bacterium]|nr:DUF1624 domain-containing protein [Lachnospiraceae bacterium]